MDKLLYTPQANINREDYAQDSMILPENAVINVKSAEYRQDYKLRLVFSDAKECIVDFGPFLHSSFNPMIRKYLDQAEFKNFTIEYGDLYWNDYDLCFPVADLYENRIMASKHRG